MIAITVFYTALFPQISGFFTGLVSSRFVKVFVGRDLRGFRYVAWTGVLTVLATAVLKAVQLFLANFLGILWRRNLVRTAHRLYFRVIWARFKTVNPIPYLTLTLNPGECWVASRG